MNAYEKRIYDSKTGIKAIYVNNAVVKIEKRSEDLFNVTLGLKCSDGGYFENFTQLTKITVKNIIAVIDCTLQGAKECGCELAPRRNWL